MAKNLEELQKYVTKKSTLEKVIIFLRGKKGLLKNVFFYSWNDMMKNFPDY